jgi:hypothetical protein
VPGGAAPQIGEVYQAADARQDEIGRQQALVPEKWALRAWKAPKADGPARAEWERRAGLVGAYREAAGITDPNVAIGPVPAGQGVLREMFTAALVALELPDDRALMAAMGNEDLEARLAERDRAMALAPAEVSGQLASVERQRDVAVRQAESATEAGDGHMAGSAGALARIHDGQLSTLRVADAARREWAEAHAPMETRAQAAEQELRSRGLAARITPVTDAEVAEAASRERETPPMDPQIWARLKAEQTAEIEADRQARHEAAEAAGAQRDTPPIDPEAWARWKAERVAEAEAAREARRAEHAEAQAPEPVDPAWWAAARAEQSARIAAGREAARAARAEAEADIPEHIDPALWEQMKAEQAADREARRAAGAEARAAAEAAAPPPVDVAWWKQAKAEQAAGHQAAREARREASARAQPVTDAEIEKYGQGRAAIEAELAAEVDRVGAQIDELAVRMGREEARRAEGRREAAAETPAWQAQAEARADLEASWQPGTSQEHSEADAEAEAEM